MGLSLVLFALPLLGSVSRVAACAASGSCALIRRIEIVDGLSDASDQFVLSVSECRQEGIEETFDVANERLHTVSVV